MTCDYFSFFFQINWYDHHGNLVNDATYKSFRMRDSKTFEARSSIRFTPRKEHHNQTYRCEAWNEAGDNLRPALARLFVEYAPSVTVTPVRPGMIQEGDKVLILRLTYIILAKGSRTLRHMVFVQGHRQLWPFLSNMLQVLRPSSFVHLAAFAWDDSRRETR